MTHKNIIRATLAMGILLGSSLFSNAQAALVSSDWKVAGDAKATLDTNTGIEWLKLNNISGQGYTLNGWLSGAYSSLFPGWRLAKTSELATVMSTYFGNPATQSGFDQTRATNWFNAFGITDPAGPSRSGSNGYTIADNGWQVIEYGQRWNTGSFQNALPWNDSSSAQLRSQTNPYSGFFLVNDGGITLSSINDPARNINNPLAPVNQPPAGTINLVSLLTGTNYADATLEYTPSGASGFSGFKYKLNGGTEQTSAGNTINLTGLTAGTSYTLEYAAYNNGGTGTWYTTTVTTQTPPPPPPPPAVVSSPMTIAAGLIMMVMGFRRRK